MACRCQDDFGPWPARGESGPINLVVNCAGARSAGNPLATCDVAGAGNQLTVRIVRHSQRKRGATDRPDLRSKGTSPRPYRDYICTPEKLTMFYGVCARPALVNLFDMIIKLKGHEVAYAYGYLANAYG